MKFIDESVIDVRAGSGGDGLASFRREKFIPKGGPSGGDGGRGGHIYALADRNINTLIEYRFAHIHSAKNGESGKSKDRYGKAGLDILLKMPVGTVISDQNTGRIIADLCEDKQKILLAEGGKGGLGNIHFKSSTNRAPRQFTKGEAGDQLTLRLELKVLADVGLLGLPNAGKSTLTRTISAARPKVADYPFTTLEPNLGTVRIDYGRSFVIADLPGLIKGASTGSGLGLRFLRHLDRTKLLLHLVEIPADKNFQAVTDKIMEILTELKQYGNQIYSKPRWLVLNKMDLFSANQSKTMFTKLTNILQDNHQKIFFISAASGTGCNELTGEIMRYLEQINETQNTSRKP